MDNSLQTFPVELQPMPHASYMRHSGEDWAGITNQRERKRLQNRINKRASRQRKRKIMTAAAASSVFSPNSDSSCSNPSKPSHGFSPCASTTESPKEDANICPLASLRATFSVCTVQSIARERAVLQSFAEHALQSYKLADPCADHKLKLIQLNVVNGLTRNATALGFSFDWLICEVVSPFGQDGLSYPPRALCTSPMIPETLKPTTLQLSARHHPWLDLFPLPKFRDNILAASMVMVPEQEQELYDDILELGDRREWSGLLVWGDPWDPSTWEVSLPFLRKWGWLLRGCPEILVATNYWRSRRGEKPVHVSDLKEFFN
ncbi:hypothetical protein B0I35DRAFT_439669 [Stachybotrys elegans]|uniref:BZIP domain-containing protein n=1 Tax=Stachybotrys elegans TaxID=80388 RepID=A0A8K0WPB2_9HYPO|nr:hypothetical protein B0I35DRAFT_439669 [Stachybotrys elegans]